MLKHPLKKGFETQQPSFAPQIKKKNDKKKKKTQKDP